MYRHTPSEEGMYWIYTYLTHASDRESIVNSVKAGLLTCNIFTILPIPGLEQWIFLGKNLFVLLTVARQLVIYTRFPINLQLSKTSSG
jgi:hypothetical protein